METVFAAEAAVATAEATAVAAEAAAIAETAGAFQTAMWALPETAMAVTPAAEGAGIFAGIGEGFRSAGTFLKANKDAIALVGAGTSAVSSIAGGISQSRALAFERSQYETMAEQTRLAAAIDTTNRIRNLSATLEAQRSLAIGRGYSLDSPDLEALQDQTEEDALADIGVARLNVAGRGNNYRLGARQTSYVADSALARGYIGAGTSLFNYASR